MSDRVLSGDQFGSYGTNSNFSKGPSAHRRKPLTPRSGPGNTRPITGRTARPSNAYNNGGPTYKKMW
jgi:hypothetical protein